MNLSDIKTRIQEEFTPPDNASLPEWRLYFLNTALLIVWLLSLFSLAIALRVTLIENDFLLNIVFIAAFLALTIATFTRRLPYNVRVGVLLLVAYGLALPVLFSLGLVSSGRVYLYTASILTVVYIGLRAGLVSVLFNAIILGFMMWQVSRGQIVYDPPQAVGNWMTTTTVFISLNALAVLSVGLLVRALAANLTEMRNFTRSLEQRVAERTRVIEAGVEVSRALTGILDSTVLIREVVEQIRATFDYYHAQIYLFDETTKELTLAGATGSAGQMMLTAGHSVLPGQGLVGRAFISNRSVLVQDVTQDEWWRPNSLLPETKAETAVPIAIGDDVLGVLDVQVNQTGGLSTDDVSFLRVVAGQVAVAVRNARLYEAIERRVHYETQVNAIGQQIQQAVTLEDALQIAAQELEQALGAQRVTVQLGGNSRSRNY